MSEAQTLEVLFTGLGSIGTRHLGNLHAECAKRGLPLRVSALRSSARALPDETRALLTQEFTSLPPHARYHAAFITGPTNLHADVIAALQGKVDCFFIEKPIFEKPAASLAALGLAENQKAYVAAPMRWTGLYIALKKLVAQGLPIYSVRAICSSYLPGWRPGADYRTVYSARRDMGGGVHIDLIHEWDYLCDLFGLPLQSLAMAGRFSHLEIDSDDLAVYIARYPGFLCELHLDYFGRQYRRDVELFSEKGSFVADFGSGTLTTPDGTEDYSEPVNRRYEREMEYFIDYMLNSAGASINSPQHAQQVLRLALGEALCQKN